MLPTHFDCSNSVIMPDSLTARYPDGAGWVDHHWVQLAYHIIAILACVVYSFFMTLLILWVLSIASLWAPALKLRIPDDLLAEGVDSAYIGDSAVSLKHNTRLYMLICLVS